MSQTGEHTYYMVRCQKRVLPTHKMWLKIHYPNMSNKCNPSWNRFKTSLDKENWYRNH